MSRKSRFLTALFSILTAAVLVASLLMQVRLTKASDENAALNVKLDEICDENTRLRIEYESSYSLPELEEYAKCALGMQRATDGENKEKITSAVDKAEILSPSDKLVSSIIKYSGETELFRSCHEKSK